MIFFFFFLRGRICESASHFELVLARMVAVKNSFKIIYRTGSGGPVLLAEDVFKGQKGSEARRCLSTQS